MNITVAQENDILVYMGVVITTISLFLIPFFMYDAIKEVIRRASGKPQLSIFDNFVISFVLLFIFIIFQRYIFYKS